MSDDVVCYYFFSHETSNDSKSISAHRSILAQLFKQCWDLESICSLFSLAREGAGDTASENELLDLLSLCLSFLPNTTLVVDGLDECQNNTNLLRNYSKAKGGPYLRILLFSRPNVACLRRISKELISIPMSRNKLNEDIAIYFGKHLEELENLELFPAGIDTEGLTQHLVERAEGMFLWAKLMVTYLHSPALTPRSRSDALYTIIPEGLAGMYRKIFALISSADQPSRKLAAATFTWVAYARTGLNVLELQEAMRDPREPFDRANLVLDIETAILLSCAGLLESGIDGVIRFIHSTAKDFILEVEWDESQQKVVQSGPDANTSMAVHCMRYLMFTVPAKPLAITVGSPQIAKDTRIALPFLSYSCQYAFYHLCSVLTPSGGFEDIRHNHELFDTLQAFLNAPLTTMVWLEAVYTLSDGTRTIDFLSSQTRVIQDSTNKIDNTRSTAALKDLQDFISDLSVIQLRWDLSLRTDGAEIWRDITAFTPSRFFRKTSALSVQEIVSDCGDVSATKERAFLTVSKAAGNLSKLAVLTIYPSR
jgi:hypothetical protein